MWEGVGDLTELQRIDHQSIGHNRVYFPFSWATQLGAWSPSLSGTCSSIQHLISHSSDPQLQLLNRGPKGPLCWMLAFSTTSCHQLVWSPNFQLGSWGPFCRVRAFSTVLSPTGLVSKLTDFLSPPTYIIVQCLPSCGRHKLHSFNLSTVKVIILIFLDRMNLLFT